MKKRKLEVIIIATFFKRGFWSRNRKKKLTSGSRITTYQISEGKNKTVHFKN